MTAPDHSAPPAGRALPSRRRGFIAVLVAWVLVLVGAAYLSSRRDPPTVREQRTIEQAAPVVSRVIGQLAAAAGARAVLAIGPPKVTYGCRLTTARDGATLEWGLQVYSATADAPAVLDRIARNLPRFYGARVRHGKDGTTHAFRADAGEFVGVRGGVSEPGVVTLTVATGCRPLPVGSVGAVPLMGTPADAMAERVLAALGAGQADRGRSDVPCPGRGAFRTARLTSRPGTVSGPLRAALHDLAAGATVVVDTPERFAYRQGEFGVVVEARSDVVTVAATMGC